MWERIILATVITVCIYLFLNLGSESSNRQSLNVENNTVSKFINRVASFSLR